VFVLEPIGVEHLEAIIGRAMTTLAADAGREMAVDDDALTLLAKHADGDARRALNLAEAVWQYASGQPGLTTVSPEVAGRVLERRVARYDKNGEEHYNLISALHKSVRGSDVDAALYWLARMLAGGEDPLYLLRRLVRIAAEDIGLSDPRALSLTLAAKDTYQFLGSPEGELAIAEAVVYLATAPKSNSIYAAWSRARQAAEEHPGAAVPLHLRNAPTRLMGEIGYGKDYRYVHAEGGFAAGQHYLPDALIGHRFYAPTQFGFEKTISERLEWWARMKKEAAHG
jgi:putative ATPase